MNFKKVMMTGAATALFVGSVMNVSAVKAASNDYVSALKESNNENLILNVEAYKAAYPDLAAAFGNDTDAYIEHYLTIGIYEGRTKGVLFDPLAYAEAYGDVKNTYGNNIAAIIDHYLTFGIAENRTAGTASGYADIAEADRNGVARVRLQAALAQLSTSDTAGVSNPGNNGYSDHAALINGVPASNGAGAATPIANSTGNVISNNNASSVTNSPVNTGSTAGNTTASNTAPSTESIAPAPTETASSNTNTNSYHHTTSIYANDDSTLLRVEYYDENNNLFEFSQVTNHDTTTNSYTEDVYSYDEATDSLVHERTDTYVNGELSSSEKH